METRLCGHKFSVTCSSKFCSVALWKFQGVCRWLYVQMHTRCPKAGTVLVWFQVEKFHKYRKRQKLSKSPNSRVKPGGTHPSRLPVLCPEPFHFFWWSQTHIHSGLCHTLFPTSCPPLTPPSLSSQIPSHKVTRSPPEIFLPNYIPSPLPRVSLCWPLILLPPYLAKRTLESSQR